MFGRFNRMITGALGSVTLLVSLGYAQAPADPAAKVIHLTGQVSVLRDRAHWALAVGDTVSPRQVIVTGPTGFAELRVSDGSTFQVFPGSTVTFRNNAPNWRDLLDLVIGRVKVEIQKLGNQPNPNSVYTPTAVISVRGTVFDVVVEESTETTFVSVEEGVVSVRNIYVPSEKLLSAGESIHVYRNLPLAKVVDKGAAAQATLRAAAQAIYEILFRTSRSGGSGGGTSVPSTGGNGGASGDKDKPAPPVTGP